MDCQIRNSRGPEMAQKGGASIDFTCSRKHNFAEILNFAAMHTRLTTITCNLYADIIMPRRLPSSMIDGEKDEQLATNTQCRSIPGGFSA